MSGSGVAEPAARARLERAVAAAVAALEAWRGRALAAEREVTELREVLEQLRRGGSGATPDRLAAENALLHSRLGEARRRLRALLSRIGELEVER